MDVKERQRLRNMVSAQQSLLKKHFEVRFLNKLVKDKDDNMKKLMGILQKRLSKEVLSDLVEDMN